MAYPNDETPKRTRILDALAARMLTIQAPAYHTSVIGSTVFEDEELVLNCPAPSVFVIPLGDTSDAIFACGHEQRVLTVDLVGVLKRTPHSDRWKPEANWLLSDMRRAIRLDQKLGGLAVWIDFLSSRVNAEGDQTLTTVLHSIGVVYRHSFDDPTA